MIFCRLILLLLFFTSFVSCDVFGLDVSQPISQGVADCFAAAGWRYIIPRGWICTGVADQAAITTHNHARAAKIPHVGFYFFPCGGVNCESASAQVNKFKMFLTSNSLTYDSIWIDIEQKTGCIWKTPSENKLFYQELLVLIKAAFGADKIGIYGSRSQWQLIFGDPDWKNPGDENERLWSPRYDGKPSVIPGDAVSYPAFSSWPVKPYHKQFKGDTFECGFSVDYNWAPTFFDLPASPATTFRAIGQLTCLFDQQIGECVEQADCGGDHDWTTTANGAVGCNRAGSKNCCTMKKISTSLTTTKAITTQKATTTTVVLSSATTSAQQQQPQTTTLNDPDQTFQTTLPPVTQSICSFRKSGTSGCQCFPNGSCNDKLTPTIIDVNVCVCFGDECEGIQPRSCPDGSKIAPEPPMCILEPCPSSSSVKDVFSGVLLIFGLKIWFYWI